MKQADKTKLTVSRILEAAIEEFGTKGYAGGTVNNICKRGINKGLIYHNFKDKDDLYLACLKNCRDTLLSLIKEKNCTSDIVQYMNIRIYFFDNYHNEAHIFFEAILQPPNALRDRIREILMPFDEFNEKIYRSAVSSLTLRDGITEDDAVDYFHQMQQMFNGYFSSPAYRNITPDQQISEHEANLPKLFNLMLYGIAKE